MKREKGERDVGGKVGERDMRGKRDEGPGKAAADSAADSAAVGGFFPQREAEPKIYAYELKGAETHKGYIKVGYTTRDVKTRVKEQTKTVAVGVKILGSWSAMREDGSGTGFTDHDVHAVLKQRGFLKKRQGTEWFMCKLSDVEAAVLALRKGIENREARTHDFPMRDEQAQAVRKTKAYFDSMRGDRSGRAPKFLWNAKMRFGKTFAAYQLAKAMGMKRVLVFTFKPAVSAAWREDLMTHIDFDGWQFIFAPSGVSDRNKKIDEQYRRADKGRPIVCFGSFQDFLGEDKATGGIKAKNKWVHECEWDLVIFDEYHFGAWRDKAKKLFLQNDEDEYEQGAADADEMREAMDETNLPIVSRYYLYLSGTPFRALNSGEFMEEQIFNWTYGDEQKAKAEWDGRRGGNPYAALPRMVMLTYKIPESIRGIAQGGEFNEFDLNEFFATETDDEGGDVRFRHRDNVQKWLDLIRGSYLATAVDDLKLGAKKPAMPFSDVGCLTCSRTPSGSCRTSPPASR